MENQEEEYLEGNITLEEVFSVEGETDSENGDQHVSAVEATICNECGQSTEESKYGDEATMCNECGQSTEESEYGNEATMCSECEQSTEESEYGDEATMCSECGQSTEESEYGDEATMCNEYGQSTEDSKYGDEATMCNECGQPTEESKYGDECPYTVKPAVFDKVQNDETANKHKANVAFYVRDVKSGKVFGITNRHVTLHADQFCIKMLSQNECMHLGQSVKTPENIDLDVGLIDVDPVVRDRLRNKENKDQNVRIYPDDFKSIFGKQIFKYRPTKSQYEVCTSDKPSFGAIASEFEHVEYDISEAEKGQFLVKTENGVFAIEGESGTAVAVRRIEETVIDLVGIICGGFNNYTLCLFLPTVFRYYKDNNGMILELYEPCLSSVGLDDHTQSCSVSTFSEPNYETDVSKKSIHFGIQIVFLTSTPEQIAPINFDLVDRALCLLCKTHEDVNLNNYDGLMKRENELSCLVNERESLDVLGVFENDKPDYVALKEGLTACDYLYRGKSKFAESCLKVAMVCVVKAGDIELRLLCQLITYITWFCLARNKTDDLKNLQKLLEIGIDCFENDFMKTTGFPSEALGYMYFDYSRYYITVWDKMRRRNPKQRKHSVEKCFRQKAVEKAKQSAKIFQEDHDKKKSNETKTRVVLAKCQHTYALLGCGHDFTTSDDVTTEEVTEAENIIKSMEWSMDDIPLVQNVDYLIAVCDIQYRKGHIPEALNTAYKCLKKSRIKEYYVGFQRASCRVEKLSKLCQ